jgi:hypothetical protein
MATTAKPTPSWHDVLKIHPACAMFDPLPDDELRTLGQDIKKNGLKSPIVLYRGKLLDGRNRLASMELVGIAFEVWREDKSRFELQASSICLPWFGGFVTLDDDADPYAYVVSANIRRRHLSIEDKDRLIIELLKADPKKSNRQVAKLTDTSHPHVAKMRKKAEKTGDVETVTTSTDTKGRNPSLHRPSG